MSTKRSLFYLHSRAASNPICSWAGILVLGIEESKFMIFSDSLSALQALVKLNSNHPLLIQTQDMLHKTEVNQKEVVFTWAPGHVGIRGNEAADKAVKDALKKEPIDDLMPFRT